MKWNRPFKTMNIVVRALSAKSKFFAILRTMIIGGYDSSNQATGDVFWYGWSGEGSSVGRWTQLDSVDATLGTPACGLYRDPVNMRIGMCSGPGRTFRALLIIIFCNLVEWGNRLCMCVCCCLKTMIFNVGQRFSVGFHAHREKVGKIRQSFKLNIQRIKTKSSMNYHCRTLSFIHHNVAVSYHT